MNWTTPPADINDFRNRLIESGLGTHTDALCALARFAIRLELDPDGSPNLVGACRLGGTPDLPVDLPWPEGDGGPLSFLMQINLAAIASMIPGDELPDRGLLSFFYDAMEQPWGFDPAHYGGWRVLYVAPETDIHRRALPDSLDQWGRFRPIALSAAKQLTFPPPESFDVEQIVGGTPEAYDMYAPVLGDRPGELVTQLLGQPEPVQGDMQHECQLASNGVYCGDGKYRVDPKAIALLKDSGQWRLLAQIDSHEDETGMMWGDVGRLYFWIREQDLKDRDWDAAWLVLQCG